MGHGEHDIDQITEPDTFLAALRALKKRSGLTYRQLEQCAAGNGDVLARSTAADMLSRSTLPRPEVLAAFIRACGQGEQVDAWLRARERLAALASAPPSEAASTPNSAAHAPAGDRAVRRRAILALLVLGAVALTTAGASVRLGWQPATLAGSAAADPTRTNAGTTAASGVTGPATGLVRIRPVRTPQLCLSEGRDTTGAYASEIAVQQPCEDSTPPDTYLEPTGGGLYFIWWDHPMKGRGCLTVQEDNRGTLLLEPWLDCRTDRWSQVFRFEPLPGEPGAYQIRPGREGLCLGIRDNATQAAAAAAIEPCTGGRDQRFLIDPVGGPGEVAGD